MFDFAIFLCCFNNKRIYCLEYSCLITSILIFPFNLLGLIKINWNFIEFVYEVIYSINITIVIFCIFIISLTIYSTKTGKITTNEFYKPFKSISLISVFIFIYLFISYGLSSYGIFKNYIRILNQNYEGLSYSQRKKAKNIIKLKSTWIYISISTLIPALISIINIWLWISLYLRIDYRIYCSFNKEIRKELRKQRKKNLEFKELQESNSANDMEKNKDKSKENNFVSVIIEKSKNPKSSSNGIIYMNNVKQYVNNNKEKIGSKNSIYKKKIKENNKSDNVSSVRNLGKNNNL
jgi:hypothetical protein